jgi:hypothetical protein
MTCKAASFYDICLIMLPTQQKEINEPLGGSSCRAKPSEGFFFL